MSHLRGTIINFFNNFENEVSSGTSRSLNTPEGMLVYGAFLINAWQKRNKSISKINSKIADYKRKCEDSEKALVLLNKSIEETKAKKEALYAKLMSLKSELVTAKRGSEALDGSVKKVTENRARALARIEETKNQIQAKQERIEALKKDLAEKRTIPHKLISEYQSVLEKIDRVVAENDKLEEILNSCNDFTRCELRILKEEADGQNKNICVEIDSIKNVSNDVKQAAQNNVELLRILNHQIEEKVLRKQTITTIDRSVPCAWTALVTFFQRLMRPYNARRSR